MTRPVRLEGWEDRLVAVMEAWRDRPFDWSDANCGHPVADAYIAMHGELPDGVAELVAAVSSKMALARALKAKGVDSLGDLIALYAQEIAPSMAQRGDIAVIDTPDGDGLAIMMNGQAHGRDAEGVMRVEPAMIKRAFAI